MIQTKKIEINGEHISYIDTGKGDITLLFIHGAFIKKEYWKEQLIRFSPDYRVLALDMAGHGASSHHRTEWTAQKYGKDISEFIERLSLKNIIMVGHSMGSDVMLEAAANDISQIIGLVEIDHMKNVGIQLPKETIAQLVASLNTDFINTARQFAKQALITNDTDQELVDKLLKDYGEIDLTVGIPILENGFNYPKREAELLESLTLKLHLIHVNYSPTDEEVLKKHLGDKYELHVMEGTCHYPMLENPDVLNLLLEKIFFTIQNSS